MKLKIDHAQITVSNLENSLSWYKRIFGFRLRQDGVYGEKPKIRWAVAANSDFMICMHEAQRKSSKENPKWEGQEFHMINHFGFRISNLRAWKKKIRDNRLKPVFVQYERSISWYVYDPDGHEIEVSYAKGAALSFPPLKNSILKKESRRSL